MNLNIEGNIICYADNTLILDIKGKIELIII